MREQNHGLVQQNRVLGAATRQLQQQVSDLAPTEEARSVLEGDVSEAMHQTEASALESKLKGELDALRRSEEELRRQVATEKEKQVANAEQFRREVMDLQQQNEDSKAKLERAEQQVERLAESTATGFPPEALDQIKVHCCCCCV